MNFENIDFIKEIKKANIEELQRNADLIREYLIKQVQKTGGHLSSNLGVIELTVALHKKFDFSKDILIFDVGHQSYVHKILTNRASKFDTLRKKNGLSGFIKESESKYDNWQAGHSSTAISAGVGYAITNPKKNIVVFVGDASLFSGMSLEALHHISDLNLPNLTIILNDNNMSISQPIGSFSKRMQNIDSNKYYLTIKKIISKLPHTSFLFNTKERIKNIFNSKQSNFFNFFNVKYYGLIDGHNISEIINTIDQSKKSNKTKLIHVKTIKGKGHAEAENDKIGNWHGIAQPGNKNTFTKWSKFIGDILISEIKSNKNINIITPAMPLGSGLTKISTEFPNSFHDVGIAEEHCITFAASIAKNDKIAIVSIYSTFLQRAVDQLIHDVSLQKLKMILLIDRAGFVGEDGETHQGIFDVGLLKNINNLVICSPSNMSDAANMISTAIKDNLFVAIRYDKGIILEEKVVTKKFNFKKWEMLFESKKNDIAVISFGKQITYLKEMKNDIDFTLVDAKILNFLDTKILDLLSKYKKIYVFEEVYNSNTLASDIKNYYYKNKNQPEIISYCINDDIVEQATVLEQENNYNLSYKKIRAILSINK